MSCSFLRNILHSDGTIERVTTTINFNTIEIEDIPAARRNSRFPSCHRRTITNRLGRQQGRTFTINLESNIPFNSNFGDFLDIDPRNSFTENLRNFHRARYSFFIHLCLDTVGRHRVLICVRAIDPQ